jgi:hypothetical protein
MQAVEVKFLPPETAVLNGNNKFKIQIHRKKRYLCKSRPSDDFSESSNRRQYVPHTILHSIILLFLATTPPLENVIISCLNARRYCLQLLYPLFLKGFSYCNCNEF